jgi:hypothetical protein
MKKFALAVVALGLLAACEVEKTPVPTDGSKADGSVVLSYQVGAYEIPKVDWSAAQSSAVQRCRAWGYSSASAFDGDVRRCESSDVYGSCTMTTISRTYQCLN